MEKLCIIVIALTALVTQTLNAELIQQTLVHEGKTRSFYFHIPSTYDRKSQTPLLIALHGRTGDGRRMATLTEFNTRADQHGFIAVYPDGREKQWNYLHGIPGAKAGADDAGFLLKLIDQIAYDYNIDKKRIYITGISNGGFMVQRLACEANNRFAAFASVAASGYAAMPGNCNNKNPMNMLYMHGTADQLVPWKGLGIEDDSGNLQQVTMSMTESLKFWSEHNNCGTEVSSIDIQPQGNSPQTRVRVMSANQCKNNSKVVLYAIIGGGHNWPGVVGVIPESIAGKVNMDIHASDVIWSFFNNTHLVQ